MPIYPPLWRSIHVPLAGMPRMVTHREEQESLRGLQRAETCCVHYCIPRSPRQGLAQSVMVKWTLVWESINLVLAVIIIKDHFFPL